MVLDVVEYVLMMLFSGTMLALLFMVPFWGPGLALIGLANQTDEKLAPNRFELIDFLALITLLSSFNSVVSIIKAKIHPDYFVVVLVGANLFGMLIWVRCLRFLVAQNIQRTSARLVTQLIIFPGTVISVGVILYTLFVMLSMALPARESPMPMPIGYHVAILITLAGAVVAIFASRILFGRLVSGHGNEMELHGDL